MSAIILTKSTTPIIGWVANLLGYIMEGIFFVLNKIGIPNIGLAIIIFTIVVYCLMLPLTIKQQKFSKLSNKMNPELQAIQSKYKGKKDNDSMMAMNQETQEVYAKYGVSPTGSCVQLIIQLPIIYALYKVIYAIPAYIGQVREAFYPLVTNLIKQQGSTEFLNNTQNFVNSAMYAKQFGNDAFTLENTFIDVLNKASTSEWHNLAAKFPTLAEDISTTMDKLSEYNNFLHMNIGDSPSYLMRQAMEMTSATKWLMVIAALSIPVLAALTQWLSVKLMPQPESNNSQQNSMMSSMKVMNTVMPLMSAVFCFSLPAGVGLYWVASAVVRSCQQVIINKHIDKMDFDSEIEKNKEKSKKKMEKRRAKLEKAGINPDTINTYANMNTRNVKSSVPSKTSAASQPAMSQEEKDAAMKKATEMYNKGNVKPGSITAKANMVRIYNENSNGGKKEKSSNKKDEA